MNQRPKLSVVIPAYNEEDRIKPTLESIDAYLENQSYHYEIIVVNDGSTDRTVEVVKKYQNTTVENLKLNANPINHGKGFAVKDGVGMAEGEYIMFMDADNATKIDEIEKFWPWFDKGFDVVIGSRHLKKDKIVVKRSPLRGLFAKASSLLIQMVLLPGIKDTQCGFKAFRRDAAKRLFSVQTLMAWGFDFEILAVARYWGLKIKEVPVNWTHVGASRLRFVQAVLRTLRELFIIKWNMIRGRYRKYEFEKYRKPG